MTSSRFREKFLTALERVARQVKRLPVGSLPPEVENWKLSNAQALQLCKEGLTEDECRSILDFFNSKFGSGWHHYCVPGCCSGGDDFHASLGVRVGATVPSFD